MEWTFFVVDVFSDLSVIKCRKRASFGRNPIVPRSVVPVTSKLEFMQVLAWAARERKPKGKRNCNPHSFGHRKALPRQTMKGVAHQQPHHLHSAQRATSQHAPRSMKKFFNTTPLCWMDTGPNTSIVEVLHMSFAVLVTVVEYSPIQVACIRNQVFQSDKLLRLLWKNIALYFARHFSGRSGRHDSFAHCKITLKNGARDGASTRTKLGCRHGSDHDEIDRSSEGR